MFRRKKKNHPIKKITDKNITNLRKKVRILIVDDEEYDVIELLKKRCYSIYEKRDIKYIEEAEPFDIIVLDIKGVGKEFGSPYEGLGYAKEVKLSYPEKIVLCYSGSSNPTISAELHSIDGFINKDDDIEKWVSKLDHCISKYLDIDYQWKAIKRKISDTVDKKTLDEIGIIYKKSFEEDSFDELKNYIMENIKDANTCLSFLISLIKLITFFA